MDKSFDGALQFAQRWIDIIHKSSITEEEGKAIIEEAKFNFAEHFNRGWLDYRKSVNKKKNLFFKIFNLIKKVYSSFFLV